jgi:alpha-glucosidase
MPESVVGLNISSIEGSYEAPTVSRSSYSSQWQPVWGERKTIPEKYNEIVFRFFSPGNPQLHIFFRMYNEGFAFRYKIINQGKSEKAVEEVSTFRFLPSSLAWISNTAQGLLTAKKISEAGAEVERPVTVKMEKNLYVSVGEAGLIDFPRMKFEAGAGDKLVTNLFEKVSLTDSLISPWRYILVGQNPGQLLTRNHLVTNLNAKPAIKNTDWIQPGKVIREVSLTTEGAFNTIDFAAAHNLRYMLFDAGWYGREDHDSSDASRVALDPLRSKGPLDLQKVIAYGKTKGIGIILYVNRRALERQLDSLLPLYKSWGIKGLKFGFVQVGSRKWTSWLHEAVRKAAAYNMIVDIHDEYRPTGYSRTYPNLLTQEGIRGDEETIPVDHSITTLFTRMIAGPADNTFCYFTNRVNKMGSHAAQLAKSVCIFSPLQFLYWYDRPGTSVKEGTISAEKELQWFDDLPVSWDETRVIESDMELFATIARKKNKEWWIGSLNGKNKRSTTLRCDFLDAGRQYVATMYSDDPDAGTRTNVSITITKVTSKSVIDINLAPQNGLAIRFVPVK